MATGAFDNPDQFSGDERERGFGRQLTRKEQTIEVCAFLLFIMPAMILAYFVSGQGAGGSFTLLATTTIIRNLALVALIAFFLWRNGESPERIGWTPKHEWTDIVLGVLLFPLVFFAAGLLNNLLQRAGFSGPSAPAMATLIPRGEAEFALAILLVIIVAISEEFIFRGYLIRRFASITRHVGWAVLLSSIIFALGHGYQGAAGVISIGFIGLVFALVYVWRGSLMAPVIMHFLQDFTAIVGLPYIMQR